MKFDHITHIRDAKSGRVIRENHYSRIVSVGAHGEPEELYERPPQSGIFYRADNTLDEVRSAAGLKRIEDAKKAAEMSEEQRYNEEIKAARKMLEEFEAKERQQKQASGAQRIQGGK